MQTLAISQVHNVNEKLSALSKKLENELRIESPVCLVRHEVASNILMFGKVTHENEKKHTEFFQTQQTIMDCIIDLKKIISKYNEENGVNAILCEKEQCKLFKSKLDSFLSYQIASSDEIKTILETSTESFELDKKQAEEINSSPDKKQVSFNFDKSITLQRFSLDYFESYKDKIAKIEQKIMELDFKLRTANGKPVEIKDELYEKLSDLGVVPKLTK